MGVTAENVYIEIQKQIRKIEKFGLQYSQQLKKAYGITGPQIGVLRMIPPDSSFSLTELSRKIDLHITTVDGIVRRLQRRKLVQKKRSKTDKRVVEVSLTERGKKIVREAPIGRMGTFYRNLQKISDDESQKIYDAMVKLVELYGVSDVEM